VLLQARQWPNAYIVPQHESTGPRSNGSAPVPPRDMPSASCQTVLPALQGCHVCLRLRRRQALRRQAAHGRDCDIPCDPELSGFSACAGQRPSFRQRCATAYAFRDEEGTSMIFTFQFVRFRRGVPEVIGERRCDAPDQTAALARARRLVGTSDWPARAEAVRVLDDAGRTLSDWRIGDSST